MTVSVMPVPSGTVAVSASNVTPTSNVCVTPMSRMVAEPHTAAHSRQACQRGDGRAPGVTRASYRSKDIISGSHTHTTPGWQRVPVNTAMRARRRRLMIAPVIALFERH